jgi:cytochrome c oxidase subunit IV
MQAQTSHPETGHTAHAMPLWILVVVWLALMFLTYITVAVSYIDLGSMNMIVAMGVATLKASLVVLFFMHLLYDKPLNALVFVTALLFVALFIVIVLLDSVHYQPELIPGYAPGLRR